MQRMFRPLWGFGWLGWMLLPVAAALAYCILGGYDLRFAILKWWFERYGWDETVWLVTSPVMQYNRSLWSPVFGPVSLTFLLLCLFIQPRVLKWYVWCVAVVWTIAAPALWWPMALWGRALVGAPWPVGPASFATSEATLGVLTVAALWRLSRSWLLVSIVLGSTGLAIALEGYQSLPGVSHPVWLYYFAPVAWNVVVGGCLLTWAVRARLHAQRELWRCVVCGYDLRGTEGRPCPECGATSAIVPV